MMLSHQEKSRKSSKVSINEDVARLEASLKRREELTSKALKVVETLIDNPVSEATLIDCCKHINQFHYKDLIEERALVLNCGYPLCKNELEKIKPQKFHISVKYNKVFDITERKNFCSNVCFKASKYLENQLNSTELWLVEQKRVSNVKFLPLDAKDGIPGEEVDLGEVKIVRADLEIPEDELVEGLMDLSLPDNAERFPMVKSIVEPSIRTEDSKLKMKSKDSIDKKEELTLTEVIERTLKEWLTLESANYLLGYKKYEKLLKSASDRCKVDIEKVNREMEEEELCRKLDIQEKEDEILDSKILAEVSGSVYKRKRVVKKLPSYDRLLEDGNKFASKVQAYYEGNGNERTSLHDNRSEIASNIVFPVVNQQEQNAVRRQIVLDKLSLVSLELLRVMGLSSQAVTSDLRMLIHTFRLTATNITFKTAQWMTLTIVMMKLLTFCNDEIRDAFKTESTTKYLTTFLKALKLDPSWLSEVVDRLLDIDNLTALR